MSCTLDEIAAARVWLDRAEAQVEGRLPATYRLQIGDGPVETIEVPYDVNQARKAIARWRARLDEAKAKLDAAPTKRILIVQCSEEARSEFRRSVVAELFGGTDVWTIDPRAESVSMHSGRLWVTALGKRFDVAVIYDTPNERLLREIGGRCKQVIRFDPEVAP